MKIELPKEILGSLPAPDTSGSVRVTATLKVNPDGSAELTEINDQPMPTGDDEGAADKGADSTADDANPMPPGSEPSMSGAPQGLY